MIKFKNVSLKYVKEFYTLFNINAEINKNTLIIGDINSGAYTMLRILAKIDKNYEGTVAINGIDLRQISDKNLDLAYIPHEPVLFSQKSLDYNLAYPLKIRKYPKKEIKNLVATYRQKYMANLPTKTNKMNLSEKKIVALIRAIMRRPKYVLIEDFFSNLDSEYVALAEKIISDLPNETTIIACENEDKNLKCYNGFSRLILNYGSLNDTQ